MVLQKMLPQPSSGLPPAMHTGRSGTREACCIRRGRLHSGSARVACVGARTRQPPLLEALRRHQGWRSGPWSASGTWSEPLAYGLGGASVVSATAQHV